MTIYVGLDLSMVSPGIAIFDDTKTGEGRYKMYGFAQRVRERDFEYHGQTTSIVLFPAIPNLKTTKNEERYEYIRKYIVDILLSPFTNAQDVVVGIEGYAFAAKNSGFSYKLHELGGVLKHSIWKKYPLWTHRIIPPTQWKKSIVGNGHATKTDIIDYVSKNGPSLDILDVLGLSSVTKACVPCPAQDLADALYLALSLAKPQVDSAKSQQVKKRKRDHHHTSVTTISSC
jgi:Holliday junction resolvasome RuvABC endonuclease subunit